MHLLRAFQLSQRLEKKHWCETRFDPTGSVQWVLGGMARLIGPDGNLATNALAGEEDAFRLQDLPEGRRDRKRYNCRKDPWVGEVMDLLAEEVFLRNVEQPWYLAPCMEQGSCQRVCFPAEFATRHKREKQGGHEMQGGSSNHKGNDMYEESEMNFGLPDFAQAGFSLDNTDELGWPDMNVPNKLGLVQAIHRKTSIERLCLIKPKHELPPKSGPKEVRSLVRQLQKCDHANVLYLHEALEDQSHLYFMYEQYSCVTLQSVLDTQWTQEDIVQIARECAAAMAFAASMNLLHLSWTLSHVLIPATRRKHPMLCKVFGLGLMGVVINDTSSSDHLCWAPECIERFHRVGPNGFLQKVEQSMKPMCDSWSLGTIVYSLVVGMVDGVEFKKFLQTRPGPGERIRSTSEWKGEARCSESKKAGSAPGATLASLSMAYMAGIVATELIVFDFGSPKAAYHFYSASLPSLVTFPQCLRIACPLMGVTLGIGLEAMRLFPRGVRKSAALRLVLPAAGLLLLFGLLSFASAIIAVKAFLQEFPKPCWFWLRHRRLDHLEEDFSWVVWP
ncbi:unnamed protein product [Durusdinium trenchii]|uniref:Protein kinase domain-containing protein n=1 Tax=Durusdinium trenchii TaxID=1381693 RepID=A0ABP0PI21_9DINO